jgi:hexosaminidase
MRFPFCLTLLIIGWLTGPATLAQTAPDNVYNLIPFPAQFSGQAGQFILNPATRLLTAPKDAGQLAAARLLATYLKTAGGFALITAPLPAKLSPAEKPIVFQAHKGGRCGPEGYVLTVTPTRVTVEAETPKGYFYAVQTLLQLLPDAVFSPTPVPNVAWTLPACRVLDRPRFSYRGLHLDVARHFMPVSFVKRYIDGLAMHKMNTFHWHLTDDQGWRIEIKKYPRLTTIGANRAQTLVGHNAQNYPKQYDGKPTGGFYTQDQIREVVRYATARHVTIIPEIEMPGHATAALAAYPELSCDGTKTYAVITDWGVFDDVFCPTEPTFTFLQDVLTEVFALFPGKYVHIGGDECPKVAWRQSAFCQALMKKLKLRDENELQSYFIKRIEKFVNAKGRVIIGWDEILEGGLAPNATVMSWRGTEGGIAAARQNHPVVMTPGAFCYLDKYQADPAREPLAIGGYLPIEKVYGYEPVPKDLTPAQQKLILGVQGNLWTEYLATPAEVEYMVWPRAAALAEIGWMPAGPRNFEDFATRLKAHLPRLGRTGINYAKRLLDIRATTQFSDADGSGARQLQVRLDKLDSDSQIMYTLTGNQPAEGAPGTAEYNAPISLSKTTTIRAMTVPMGERGFSETFQIHRAKGKPYTYTEKPTDDPDAAKLTDGQVAQAPQSATDWVTQDAGKDVELTIDLGEVRPVTKVSVNFLKKVLSNVLPPKTVEIALSKDGQDYREAIARPVTYPLEGPWSILPVIADFKTARARYVRLRARNAGPSPMPLPRLTGKPTVITLDEVIVD